MSNKAMNDGSYIAMTHTSCPICGAKTNESIMLHTRFRDISEMHNKSTGFSDPCETCQKGLDDGAIMIIIYDRDRSKGSGLKDIYRCGMLHGITEDAAKRLISNKELLDKVLKQRVMLMDYRDADVIGLEHNYDGATGGYKK